MTHERSWRRGVPSLEASASPAEPRRPDEAAAAFSVARSAAAGIQQVDVLALQRSLGNAATAALLSRAPAARPVTTPGRTPLKVQRSFIKKVKRRLGLGKAKPQPSAAELLADPTQWEDTKVGPAGAPWSTAKPRKKPAKAEAKTIRESQLVGSDTKSEGEDTVVEVVKPRGDYSAYQPAGSLRDDAPYTVANDDVKSASESSSESVVESSSESESESEEKSSTYEVAAPPERMPYRDAFPVDEKDDSAREEESESESDSAGEDQSFSDDEAEVKPYQPADQSTEEQTLYEVHSEEGSVTVYKQEEEAKAEAEAEAEAEAQAHADGDIEFSEDEAKSELESVASRLAPRRELKADAPYPKTLSKDKRYDKEATDTSPDLEPVFIGPARQRVWYILNNQVPSADIVGGEDWVRIIKTQGRAIAKARRAGKPVQSDGVLMRRFIGAMIKPSVHWTDEDVERYIDDNGMLRTDADHKAVVKYLNADERVPYELHRDKGFFTQGANEDPFDTAAMATNLAGPGFGIYVMDSEGKMYAESHKVGLFHHSSFLAGGDVAAAGELKVTNGALQTVTNKTGHYKAGVENLLQALDRFQAWGVSLSSFDVSLVTAGIVSRDQLAYEKADVFYRRERAKAGSA